MPSTVSKSLILFFVILLISGGMLSTEIYLPSLPTMTLLFGASAKQLQMTITVYFLTFGISQLFYGPLSDYFGRKPMVLIGISVFMLGTILCLSAQNVQFLLLGRFLQGAGMGAGSVIARAILRDVFSGDALTRMTAYMSMAMAVVPVLAPTLGGYLQDTFNWRANFWVLLGYGIIIFTCCAVVIPETVVIEKPHQQIAKHILRNYQHLLSHRVFIVYLLCLVLSFSALVAYATESPFLLQQKLGLTATQNGYAAIFVGSAFVIGAAVHNQLIKHFSLERVMKVGMQISMAAALLSLLMNFLSPMSVASIVVPVVLFALGMGFFNPGAMAGALAPFPHMAGAAGALIGCGFMLASAAASSVIAVVSNGTAIPLAVILCLISLWVWLIFLLARH